MPFRVAALGVWGAIALLALVTAVALGAAAKTSPVTADSLGYVTAGRLLAEGEGMAWRDDVNEIAGPFSSPMAFPVRRGEPDELRFGYPAGFPLVIAAGVEVAGTDAATRVAPVFGGLAVLSAALLAYAALASHRAALAAAGLTAVLPDLWRFGTDAWADVPTAALAGLALAMVIMVDGATSVRSARLRAVAGAGLLGSVCWMRPAGLFVLGVVALVAVVHWRRGSETTRAAIVPFVAVVGTAVASLLVYQRLWFGDALSSGYSPESGWYPHPPFRLSYAFGRSFVGEASVTAALGTLWHNLGAGLLVAVAGVLVMRRRVAVLLGAAVVAMTAPYLVYAFPARGVNARFVLPALPLLVVLAVGTCMSLGGSTRTRRGMVVALVAASAVVLVPRSLDAWQTARAEADDTTARAREAVAIAARTPRDAVLISYEWNDLLAVYGQRSVLNVRRVPPSDTEQDRYRTDLLPTCLTAAVDELLDAGRSVFVVDGATPASIDPLPILRGRFELETLGGDPALLRVVARSSAVRASVEPCLQATV